MCRRNRKAGGITSLKHPGSSSQGEVLTFLMKTPQPAQTRLHSSQRAPVSHKPDHDACTVSNSPVAFHLIQRSLRRYKGLQGNCLIWPHHLCVSLCSQCPYGSVQPRHTESVILSWTHLAAELFYLQSCAHQHYVVLHSMSSLFL